VSPAATARRIGAAARKPANWVALAKFGLVGASGYLVNLAVFAAAFSGLGFHHIVAAVIAFAVAVTSNFHWNRRWTFSAARTETGAQAMRFLAVSLGGLVINLVVLQLLVSGGATEVVSQAIAVAVVMPLNFVGNKLWTFG